MPSMVNQRELGRIQAGQRRRRQRTRLLQIVAVMRPRLGIPAAVRNAWRWLTEPSEMLP